MPGFLWTICFDESAAERRDVRARLVWGANPVSLSERPRPVAFARTGKLVRTAARFDGASQDALQRDYCAWLLPPPDLGK